MQLFYQQPEERSEDACEAACNASFNVPDVYISDRVKEHMEKFPAFADTLMELLQRFSKDDYGFVTQDEKSMMLQIRYIAASRQWMLGRYATEYGPVVFETLYDMSVFYFATEDITDVCMQQLEKHCSQDHVRVPLSHYRHWQICYVG